MKTRSLLAILLSLALRGVALEEAPYTVADERWAEGLGNHRAVLHVEEKADAVVARIQWRRRDRDPERKDIIVMDATTGLRLTNVVRLSNDRFEGVLAFQPQTAPGDYFVYYLPYPPQKGWGSYTLDYFKPQDKADPAWKAKVGPSSSPTSSALPTAKVLRLEARSEFDSFYPMEVVATSEEAQAMLDRSAAFTPLQRSERPASRQGPERPAELTTKRPEGRAPYLLFPEDRRFPIRMKDELPLRWVKSGPTNVFRGEAQRNEFYVFQIGVWAARTNLAGLNVEFSGTAEKWLRCFNTDGVSWDGESFHKQLKVSQGQVQALWFGVDVPSDAKPGERRAIVTIRPTNAPASSVELVLTVLPTELTDRGDGDLWRLARLRWLDSQLGAELSGKVATELIAPYATMTVKDRTIHCLGKEVRLGEHSLPDSIQCRGQEILAGPISAVLQSPGKEPNSVTPRYNEIRSWVNNPTTRGLESSGNQCGWRWLLHDAPGRVSGEGRVEPDGRIGLQFDFLKTTTASEVELQLVIPLRREAASYFMGLGQRACPTPTNFTWRWSGPYDSFWLGNAQTGLHVELRGGSYHGPMLNLYHPPPPPTWFNQGRGSVTITNGPSGECLVVVSTALAKWSDIEGKRYEVALLPTPVKPLDPATHFRERYWHSTASIPDSANVINVHHATVPNPYINYPFLALDKLREFTHAQQARGKKVKLYYTVRELTSRLPELWALRSLGDEVLAGGPGGGYPWLREHLGGDYTPQWYTQVEGGQVDAAILTSGASRWYNFYVEGLNWLVRNVPIDGLYLDDVAFDRTILKRMRKVMDRARPGCLIDLHSNTAFSKGPAVQYAEYFPYVDRLWFGESFDYDAMTPEQWLVECSGIPFGLMGDMLQGGGNRWRGMVFGMTVRPPWVTDGVSCNPDAIWKLWDDFGIADAKTIGWWEKDCPVRTGRDDVLATAYVSKGKTLIALASWAKEPADVRLQFDWHALDIDLAKARLVAPEIKDFQPSREWRPDEAITVEPKRGWLIYVSED